MTMITIKRNETVFDENVDGVWLDGVEWYSMVWCDMAWIVDVRANVHSISIFSFV